MKAYLVPLALLAALMVGVNANAGVLGDPQQAAPEVSSGCDVCCCDPCCCTPVLNALRNARARLACLLTPPCVTSCPTCECDPCCCRPVLSRVRAALCCPPAVLCRIKAALCCPPACAAPAAEK